MGEGGGAQRGGAEGSAGLAAPAAGGEAFREAAGAEAPHRGELNARIESLYTEARQKKADKIQELEAAYPAPSTTSTKKLTKKQRDAMSDRLYKAS